MSPLTHSGLRRAGVNILVVGGFLAAAWQVAWIATAVWPDPASIDVDAGQVWHQAERIRADQPLYEPIAGYGPHYMWTVRYPSESHSPHLPLLASIVALLPPVSLATFLRVWYVVILLAGWGYAATLSALSTGSVGLRGTVAWNAVLVAWPGSLGALFQGNPEPVLWLLFGLAMALSAFRGGFLALMAGVKPYALFPLAAAVGRERGPVVRAAVWAALGTALVCVVAMGPADLAAAARQWWTTVPAQVGQGTWKPSNLSLSFLPVRFARARGWVEEVGPLPVPARHWLLLAGIAGPALAAWGTRRLRPRLQYGLTMVAAVLSSPLCWPTYLTYGFVPLALLLGPDDRDPGAAGALRTGGTADSRTPSDGRPDWRVWRDPA